MGGCLGQSDPEMTELSILTEVRGGISRTWTSRVQIWACLGDLLRELLGRQSWRTVVSRKVGHSSRQKSSRHRSRLSPCAGRWGSRKENQPGWSESFGGNSGEKKAEFTEFLTCWGKGRLRQRGPWMSWGYAERKLEEPNPSWNFFWVLP